MAAKNADFSAAHNRVMKTIKREVAALRKRKASHRTSKDRKSSLRDALGAMKSVQRSVGGVCQQFGGDSMSSRRKS